MFEGQYEDMKEGKRKWLQDYEISIDIHQSLLI